MLVSSHFVLQLDTDKIRIWYHCTYKRGKFPYRTFVIIGLGYIIFVDS